MGRLVRGDRKATVTQITTPYNQGRQNTISECTTCRTLKQMVYSSRRPHQVPLLSAKNRKWRLQFTQADESRFLLRHSDGRVRIWCKEHEIMDPSCPCLNGSGWWWWCNGVGIFVWHTLVPIEHYLNITAYLIIVADHVYHFMTTVYPSSDDYFQQNNAIMSQSSSHLRLVS